MGRTCVIPGASQGIGRATAVRLSREPDIENLVLVARSLEGLEGTRSEMEAGKSIKLVPFDLAQLERIPGLVREIHDEFGGIDALLNIAGYAEPRSLLDTTAENLINTYSTNVFAMLLLIREVVSSMLGRRAKILNIASTAGTTARPGWVAYASSKAAVVSLSQTLSEELAGTGIKIYTISPGRTATELRRKLAPEEDPSTIMQPSTVADVIAFLLSDAERTLDGQNITVRESFGQAG
jgi:short-subunit dehydrogenase